MSEKLINFAAYDRPPESPKTLSASTHDDNTAEQCAGVEQNELDYDEKSEDENTDDEYDEDGYPNIVLAKSGLYEWSFDLTAFNDDEQDGVDRFKELLSIFGLEYAEPSILQVDCDKFVWISNKEDAYLKLVTCNNPITGQDGFSPNSPHREKGYLSYVGVESGSEVVLREFLQEFRKRATFIKQEANGRCFC